MKIIDITPPISSSLAVFPGDVPFERKVSMDFSLGDHLQLSSFQTTFHLGAHADSSSHYHAQGEGVEKRDLSAYLGKCQVINVPTQKSQRIRPEMLNAKIEAPRVLFRTMSFPDPNSWNGDFMSLSPELIEKLVEAGVRLVGIDTPSVDPADSKALESHQKIFETKLCILEGLYLNNVTAGIYQLIALPLPFVGADASPVRAVLLQDAGFSVD